MRNDHKEWKRKTFSKGGRTGKQFGGGLTRPLGGVGGVGAPVRPLGFKGGARVKKVHGGALATPLARARPFGFKKGSEKPSSHKNNVYKKK